MVFRAGEENDAASCYDREITASVSLRRQIILSHLSLSLELLTEPGIHLLRTECLRHKRNEVTQGNYKPPLSKEKIRTVMTADRSGRWGPGRGVPGTGKRVRTWLALLNVASHLEE